MSDNIQVAVRCRGRNPQEIAAKSPVIVELPHDEFDPEKPFVTITNDPTKTLSGIANIVPSSGKTFKLDQVYGPNADQTLIFNNVALPLFHDFINGLNVTILAYGQTGSGKTHSMCGDLTGENAGIIPRVLSRLFTSADAGHIVKISCVELYKEELHDLVSDGVRTAASSKTKLRLAPTYANERQSTVIHNLTEVPIDSCETGFNILKTCLSKRRTSATKLNDISSRSHTIFSINLFRKKEGSATNEEFVKSTMNLVDLAGSEDINKSGAVNERAREAGSINQSLLALGKVISALSEGKDLKHVPYRESKLTRILQGSIGGQTKTALIATISPAKVNMSETVSTLNYASKAKNIRNMPQSTRDTEMVNGKLLFADLVKQCSRTYNDLLATRDKENNVKISVQTYQEFCNARIEHETTKKEDAARIDKLTSRLDNATKESMLKDQKLDALRVEHDELRQKTKTLLAELAEMKASHAHQQQLINERDHKIVELQKTAVRMQQTHTERKQQFDDFATELRGKMEKLCSSVDDYLSSSAPEFTKQLDSQMETLLQSLLASLQAFTKALDKFTILFGSEWEDEIARYLREDLDFLKDIETLRKFDVTSELSRFESLESQARAKIDHALLLAEHEERFDRLRPEMAKQNEEIETEYLPAFRDLFKLMINACILLNLSVCKENMTSVLNESSLATTKAMDTLSGGRAQIASEIASKTHNHSQQVLDFENNLKQKTLGAGARIYHESNKRIKHGIQPLVESNTSQGGLLERSVQEGFANVKSNYLTSNETLRSKIEGSKRLVSMPLTEIKESNRPQTSPKRKWNENTECSPHRVNLGDSKRRKAPSPTKDVLGAYRSQIPQLQPPRNKQPR